ncbi:MAG: hypothetical protein U1F71_03240 [Verrucomicrobiaceae bacterium]
MSATFIPCRHLIRYIRPLLTSLKQTTPNTMTSPTPEIILFSFIAIAAVVLRFWISRQKDASAARLRVLDVGLWIVTVGALLLSAVGVFVPALRPTSPVGLFVAFAAIYLLVSRQRSLKQEKTHAA